MDGMSMPPSNAYVEVLNSNVMVFGGRAFGKYLGHRARALTSGISALRKRTLEGSLTPSVM